jgi:hypothetical protein
VPAVRLARADTVLMLDFSLPRCAWRALHRPRDRADFWWWMLTWRRRYLPTLLTTVATYAPLATVHRLRIPRQLQHWFSAKST